MAHRSRPSSWMRAARNAGLPSRWATRSWRSACSKRAWTSRIPTLWSRSRTLVRRDSRRAWPNARAACLARGRASTARRWRGGGGRWNPTARRVLQSQGGRRGSSPAAPRGVFRRYDHMVGDATVVQPGGDAAMLRIKGTRLGLAVTTDCNSRYCHLDPHLGAQLAVAEAARNIVATGARPLAVTDCLNLANPDRPEVYWELEETVAGLAYACRALELPIVSGNVSLYNDSNGESALYPSPVVGMVGVIDDYGRRLGAGLRAEGDFVLLIGSSHNDMGGSEYLKVEHGYVAGRPPALDLTREQAVNRLVLAAAENGFLHSAHDCAEGGMLVALAECCLLGGIGVRCPAIRPEPPLRLDAAFFGESPSRYIVSVPSRAMPELQSLARRHHVELSLLGLAGGDAIEFEGQLKLSLGELREAWEVMVP